MLPRSLSPEDPNYKQAFREPLLTADSLLTPTAGLASSSWVRRIHIDPMTTLLARGLARLLQMRTWRG
jgi:hypothetical protein